MKRFINSLMGLTSFYYDLENFSMDFIREDFDLTAIKAFSVIRKKPSIYNHCINQVV